MMRGIEAMTPPPVVHIDYAGRAPPFSKQELCERDYKGYNKVLDLLSVESPLRPQVEVSEGVFSPLQTPAPLTSRPTANRKYPRIFCYVNTISPYHKSHAQLVADTWAQRCDKTVFFSNVTGTLYVNQGTDQEIQFEVIKMNAPADYWHLWMKHKEVVKYIHDHYRHDYDWFYKADDDAYVVVDNLRAYLRRPEIVNNYQRQPIQLGKRFNLTASRMAFYLSNEKMRDRWWSQRDRLVFNSGGPGYAMNRLFIDKFTESMTDKSCLSEADTSPEDTGTSFCMSWHDVSPWDTRDLNGRPRWHAFNPASEYGSKPPDGEKAWYHEFNEHVGGYKWGKDCCAPDSIGFHYVKKGGMHHVERMLYFCRTGDDVPDITTFNARYGLAISHNVQEYVSA